MSEFPGMTHPADLPTTTKVELTRALTQVFNKLDELALANEIVNDIMVQLSEVVPDSVLKHCVHSYYRAGAIDEDYNGIDEPSGMFSPFILTAAEVMGLLNED